MKNTTTFTAALAIIFVFFSASAVAQRPDTNISDPAKQVDNRTIVVEQKIKKDFNIVLDTFRQQLKDDGWNIIAEFDFGKRLAKKGKNIPGGLTIFKLTSGKFAAPLLAKDETRYISAMMPCGVSVYGKKDGTVTISRMNFEMMAGMMEPKVASAMEKATNKLNKTIATAMKKLSSQ